MVWEDHRSVWTADPFGRAIVGNAEGRQSWRTQMHTDYLNPVIRQLRDQQVRFAPRDKKVEQVNRAEKLLTEIDPGRTYPYEYLCYRITDFRPGSFPAMKIR